ncbi:unnamed protein product [Closterium sp. NIES-54]
MGRRGSSPPPPPLPPAPIAPPLVADLLVPTPLLTTGDEGISEASPVAPASGIAGGRRAAKRVDRDVQPTTTGVQVQKEAAQVLPTLEQQMGKSTVELLTKEKSANGPTRGEQPVEGPTLAKQLVDDGDVNHEGELSAKEESTDNDVVEVPVEKPELRRSGRSRKPPERLSFHACLRLAAFTTLLDDAEADVNLPELDPDVHADPDHRWDIATMTVKEALARWKGKAVKAAMDKEIRSLIGMGTWELVKRPRSVNIMKNRWVLMTKYHIDDTVAHEKARLVVKGFTQVYGADYDETHASVNSYVTLRIFLSIVAVLELNLMQLDSPRSCGTRRSSTAANWKKSQVDEALYFKVGDDGVTCWVLVYVNDLLAASSSTAMLKELKELLEAAFELREISPVKKYLRLEIVRDRQAKKLWLQQQSYVDKLRWRFIDEEQTRQIPKTPVCINAYGKLTFDDEDA